VKFLASVLGARIGELEAEPSSNECKSHAGESNHRK